MEAITRLVSDSLARHGLDRPIDPRRLQWSRWFRCDSTHSLLVVPSKPGIFALAEEIMDLGAMNSDAAVSDAATSAAAILGGAALQRCDSMSPANAASAAEGKLNRRMLAVLQFSEDDDMAFTLDRMFTRFNPMRARLASGRCFLRFVVIEDQDQRRSICAALNQWMLSSAEKASGIPADFSSSLELELVTANVVRVPSSASAESSSTGAGLTEMRTPQSAHTVSTSSEAGAPPSHVTHGISVASHLDSGAAKNLHCPHSFPSGF